MPTAESIAGLAAEHGLPIDPATVRVNEAGLDYRVAIARSTSGESWVLRMPRREDVAAKITEEAAILDVVRPHLSVAVPDWQIRSDSLIAYPLLPGEPGLTVDEQTGEPRWHLDPQSPRYASAFGELLAELHGIPVEQAKAGGMPIQSPDEVRAQWHDHLAAVAADFTITPALHRRWRSWIEDDSFWPGWSVCTHGELYPAHVLIDDEQRPTAVLDWTTAKVADPGRDFALQHAIAGPETFAITVDTYERAGGRTWPRLADHCAELVGASPIDYAVYALMTGQDEHRATAQEMLDPSG